MTSQGRQWHGCKRHCLPLLMDSAALRPWSKACCKARLQLDSRRSERLPSLCSQLRASSGLADFAGALQV